MWRCVTTKPEGASEGTTSDVEIARDITVMTTTIQKNKRTDRSAVRYVYTNQTGYLPDGMRHQVALYCVT